MANTFIFFILAITPAVFATEEIHGFDDVDVLKNLTDQGSENISHLSNLLDNLPDHYRDIIAERYECILWECVVEQENVNRTTAKTVAKGLSANKKLISFQCISDASRETFDKLNKKCSTLPQESEAVLTDGLNAVMPYRLLIPGFDTYVQDLYQTKREELNKASSSDARKKILLEVENKMKYLNVILNQITAEVNNLENNFFEIYVDFVHAAENLLRKVQREGSQKIIKCVG